jgi:transposase-like protein
MEAVEDYPGNLGEFEERFGSEDACLLYLYQLRWPEGFVCPRCGCERSWRVRFRDRFECAECGRQTSPTAGTIFHGTRVPLRIWFRAMWWVTSQKSGASALGLQRILGLGSYKTAWLMLHKLRRAMVRPGRDRLEGRVEVDEVFVGGHEEGIIGRNRFSDKQLVAIAAQEDGAGIGRIRLRCIPDAKARSLTAFVRGAVEPGSVVRTDGWPGYKSLPKEGYIRENAYIDREVLPRVHRVASLLKRWLLGTFHGAVSHEHLDEYLNEFTFRFNRRTSRSRGKLFYRLAQQAVAIDPVPYKAIIRPARTRSRQHNR